MNKEFAFCIRRELEALEGHPHAAAFSAAHDLLHHLSGLIKLLEQKVVGRSVLYRRLKFADGIIRLVLLIEILDVTGTEALDFILDIEPQIIIPKSEIRLVGEYSCRRFPDILSEIGIERAEAYTWRVIHRNCPLPVKIHIGVFVPSGTVTYGLLEQYADADIRNIIEFFQSAKAFSIDFHFFIRISALRIERKIYCELGQSSRFVQMLYQGSCVAQLFIIVSVYRYDRRKSQCRCISA